MRFPLAWMALALSSAYPLSAPAAPTTLALVPTDSASARSALERVGALDLPSIELIPAADVGAVAKSLGADLTSPGGRLAVARALGAQGLLTATPKRRRIDLRLRSAGTDVTVSRLVVRGSARALPGRAQRKAPRWLKKHVGALLPAIADTRAVLLDVSGLAPRDLQASIERNLERIPGLTLVEAESARAAAESSPGGLFGPGGRAAAMAALDVQVFLRIRLLSQGRDRIARIEVLGDGFVDDLEAEARSAKTLGLRVRRAVVQALLPRRPAPAALPRTALGPAPPPPPAAPTPKTEAPVSDPATAEVASVTPAAEAPRPEAVTPAVSAPSDPAGAAQGDRNRAALEVSAGLGAMGRRLRYVDDLFEELRPYDLAVAPVLAAEMAWYPAAHFTRGWATAFGVEARFAHAVAVSSEDPEGRSFDTRALAFDGGARVRLGLGPHAVGLALGGGLQRFGLTEADDGTAPDLPGVSYAFVRVGADAHLRVGESVAVRPRIGWRQVLSAGEITDDAWFPRSSVWAFDAGLTLGYALLDNLEAEATGQMQRYVYDLGVQPDDPRVAGGAVDQYWSAYLSLTWFLDGR